MFWESIVPDSLLSPTSPTRFTSHRGTDIIDRTSELELDISGSSGHRRRKEEEEEEEGEKEEEERRRRRRSLYIW
ncbi:hypothetical protein ElyMa_005394200 [Elysia marginata]|uniref:Uncharacterized protein n=1 Tax=Elysia marginata TaxID=1093978 RepID=A0AAV4EGA6_9GAST|nr:hypothetical protein ElyMa_005394200 [Elysia marginata]